MTSSALNPPDSLPKTHRTPAQFHHPVRSEQGSLRHFLPTLTNKRAVCTTPFPQHSNHTCYILIIPLPKHKQQNRPALRATTSKFSHSMGAKARGPSTTQLRVLPALLHDDPLPGKAKMKKNLPDAKEELLRSGLL